MAEPFERNHRRRRRDRAEYSTTKQSDDASLTINKPPVTILGLAKPSRALGPAVSEAEENAESLGSVEGDYGNVDTSTHQQHAPPSENSALSEKTSVVLLTPDSKRLMLVKSNDGDTHYDQRSHLQSHAHQNDDITHNTSDEAPPVFSAKKTSVPSVVGNMISGVIDQGAQTQSKLAPPLEKQGKIKLIDDNFLWCESGLELMLDQTDFVVVGIVGLQGCGKSTLLSLLAGNTHQDAYRNYFFFPQTKEAKEDCLFQTSGVEMLVTSERVILLDTQPLLSAAMMYCLIRYERKCPSEYTSLQNFIEVQSMQLLTFLLSVCNVVIVADDWFTDVNFLRFIQDAEMLKPSTQSPPPSSDGSSVKEDGSDFYPTVIFVHNKASREDFTPETYSTMQQVLHRMFSASKLKTHNNINMTNNSLGGAIIQHPADSEDSEANRVNLLVLPVMEFYKSEPEWLQTSLPEYRGYPSFNTLLSFFRAQILSAPRSPLTPNTLTEKNWYHFAARMWETVKKSSLLSEYNRLLSASN